MTYQEFQKQLLSYLEVQLPADTHCAISPVHKNNGTILMGLSIRPVSSHVAPTIYLEPYYEMYHSGELFTTVANHILSCYYEHVFPLDFDIDSFSNYETIRSTIVYKLIHYEKNKDLLQDLPHLPFFDLALVFYCLLPSPSKENTTILIRNSHLQSWNISLSTLYEDAKSNTPQLLDFTIQELSQVISSFGSPFDSVPYVPLYVLTNARKFLGASCFLYEGILEKCASYTKGNYYILPSSIHEVLFISESFVSSVKELKDMVCDVNQTLDSTDVLSDSVYHYNASTKQLTQY